MLLFGPASAVAANIPKSRSRATFMPNTVELFVFEVPGNSPDGLLAIPAGDREKRSTFTHKATLFAMPPPDTLFMRATGLDLSVFGEKTREGELQMIDGASLSKRAGEELERFVNRHPDSTVQALAALAKKHAQPCDETALRTALESDAWPTGGDALLQAAAFARVLWKASTVALPKKHAIVWLYRGGPLSYRYP